MFTIDQSLLLVIDVQGNLAYRMHEHEALLRNIQKMIKAAQILDIPIIYTEQVPEKIGKTIPEVTEYLINHQPIVKTTFSCCCEPAFLEALQKTKRKQIIVVGIETHVCVYQTVIDLLKEGYEIEAVADAISSRTLENKTYALKKIVRAGAELTTCEMLVTELLRDSKHPKFKEILGLIR